VHRPKRLPLAHTVGVEKLVLRLGLRSIFALGLAATPMTVQAADAQVERGKYVVEIIGCTDCHTPGSLIGRPDTSKYLGGSDVGFAIPGYGVFVGPNLTSDKQTGLGNWTAEQIVAAITEGKRPDGRVLAPVMPSQNFAHLTKSDALAVAAYLKGLPPISNKVPGPFGPGETPTSLVMSVQPGDVYAKLPQPK
jgi:mono/diheme cytochrome c family protein